ncbi:unnamed protein product [Enterobius vermicularis]|uniref:Uncharacterized protein n=1 Tax=Enterobius vermicularis TaxID=51028 RepID=A0A0N4UYV0_ENTVE|nr:unnamed protein product [Enterobius vermicularis]
MFDLSKTSFIGANRCSPPLTLFLLCSGDTVVRISEGIKMPQTLAPNAQPTPSIPISTSRFKIVPVESHYQRGRWSCYDYYGNNSINTAKQRNDKDKSAEGLRIVVQKPLGFNSENNQVLLAHFVYVYAPQIVCSSMKAVDIKRLRNKNLEQQNLAFNASNGLPRSGGVTPNPSVTAPTSCVEPVKFAFGDESDSENYLSAKQINISLILALVVITIFNFILYPLIN